ncbi:hypothetical protein LBMAG26_14950 [Bacteroidota bacterium]|nr:hypothetical protein LBMAG26_14950 [Bacteroidota bacterium]
MKNKTITTISAGTSYSMFKLTESSLDPYTRFAVGLAVGSGIVFKRGDENPIALSLGIGVIIGSALQLIDVAKGGRLIKNQCNLPVYIIGENSGLSVLECGQVPSGNVDGFSFKGLNGVFKLSDGVYANINSNNSIRYTPGLGRFINQIIRSGGYKTKHWVDQQTDLRWKELYDRSI